MGALNAVVARRNSQLCSIAVQVLGEVVKMLTTLYWVCCSIFSSLRSVWSLKSHKTVSIPSTSPVGENTPPSYMTANTFVTSDFIRLNIRWASRDICTCWICLRGKCRCAPPRSVFIARTCSMRCSGRDCQTCSPSCWAGSCRGE